MTKICSVEGCNGKHDAKGFCKKHYARFRRYGNPLFVPDPEESRKKNSEKHRGKKPSLETRRKRSESMKKRKPHENSLEALRKANIARIGTKRPEVSKKLSKTMKIKWTNSEFRNKQLTYKHNIPKKVRSKLSVSLKKVWKNPEYRTHQSKSHKGMISPMKGKHHSVTTKNKISLVKRKWFDENPEEKQKSSLRTQRWLKEHPEFREQASERRSKQKFPS